MCEVGNFLDLAIELVNQDGRSVGPLTRSEIALATELIYLDSWLHGVPYDTVSCSWSQIASALQTAHIQEENCSALAATLHHLELCSKAQGLSFESAALSQSGGLPFCRHRSALGVICQISPTLGVSDARRPAVLAQLLQHLHRYDLHQNGLLPIVDIVLALHAPLKLVSVSHPLQKKEWNLWLVQYAPSHSSRLSAATASMSAW